MRKVRQRYRYDGANSRTVKQTLDSGTTPEAIALYPYPGDFERRGLTRGATAYEASSTLETETQYVVAGARMVWKHGGAGAGYDRENRLAVPIGDLIQTTGAVFDVRSGELLEVSTYYPNGARETYLNDDSARAAPEVFRALRFPSRVLPRAASPAAAAAGDQRELGGDLRLPPSIQHPSHPDCVARVHS